MNVKERNLEDARRSPLVVECASQDRDLACYVAANLSTIEEKLLDRGALLFRGFDVDSVERFSGFVEAAAKDKLDYVYGSTPRTSIGNRIFTATEYPPTQEIPLHQENSYQRVWPLKIALCCLIPASTGGETPIADMRRVSAAIGGELMDKFENRGVRYVRHYRPFVDVPWQKVFQTEDPSAVGKFCAQHDIAHEWLDEETLRTAQVCQGVAYHPVLGERVFFNQAHLFHLSSVAPEVAQSMTELFGADRLPRQTFFGDGAEIPLDDLSAVRRAFQAEAQSFPWRAGDVVLLDNMQFAHGRRSFTGPRKVIAALMDECTSERATRGARSNESVGQTSAVTN